MIKKRVLACFLTASLTLTAIPSSIFAEEIIIDSGKDTSIESEAAEEVSSEEIVDDIVVTEEVSSEDSADDIDPLDELTSAEELIDVDEETTNSIQYDEEEIVLSEPLGAKTSFKIIYDDNDDMTLIIEGTGPMVGFKDEYPWEDFKSEIKYIRIGEGITEISDYAFCDFTEITQMYFPDSLRKIGKGSFQGCINLYRLSFPFFVNSIGEEAFLGCESLQYMDLPEFLVTLGREAFTGCKSLERVDLYYKLETLGYNAFSYCENLEIVNIHNRNTVMECVSDPMVWHPFTNSPKVTIGGYTGSTAEAFAYAYNIPFNSFEDSDFNPVPLTEITEVPCEFDVSLTDEMPYHYFSFVADETTRYNIRSYFDENAELEGINPRMRLFTEDGISIDYTSSRANPGESRNMNRPYLEKGKTYYIYVFFHSNDSEFYGCDPVPVDFKINITPLEPVIYPESMGAMKVSLIDVESYFLPSDHPDGYYCYPLEYAFVPEKSGWYSFASQSDDLDTKILIKDGDTEIGTNDNVSDENKNFSLNVYLTEGTKYSVIFGLNNRSRGIFDLSVKYGCPLLRSQPESVRAGVGQSIQFSVEAENVKSYQWQYQKAGTSKWITSTASGSKTNTLSLKVSSTNKTNLYRCKLVGLEGGVIYTEPAGIDLIPGVKITKQPESRAVMMGDYAVFSVEAENTSVVATPYQWQYSKDGVKWYNSSATGSTTNTLTVKSSKTNRGYYYRCAIIGLDGNKKYTSKVGMVILTKYPVPCSGKIGVTAEFSVKTNEEVSYQWQYSKNYSKWYSSSASGATTDTMQVKESSTNQYYSYRCKLTRADGIEAYTTSVGFNSNTWIDSLPVSVTAGSQTTVSFSVVAYGVENYQWQWSKDGKTWTTCTAAASDESSLVVPVNAANKTYKYRCRLEDPFGGVVYTNVVTIS